MAWLVGSLQRLSLNRDVLCAGARVRRLLRRTPRGPAAARSVNDGELAAGAGHGAPHSNPTTAERTIARCRAWRTAGCE